MICLFCCGVTYSQQFPNIQLSYLTEKEGLSSNEVSCISQDADGFIWIGTLDGLNRFDGYRVKHFYHDPANENSLVNNSIYRIAPDKHGRLWITTREGLTVFDKNTGVFHNFRHNPSDINSIDDDQYSNIYTAPDNTAWLTTPSSVYSFDSTFHYKKVPSGITDLPGAEQKKISSYGGLMKDREGRLWASYQAYVFLINPKTMRMTRKFGPFIGNIQTLFEDSNHEFWIGSFGGGLVRFDRESGTVSPVKLTNPYNTIIYSITEWWDKTHRRWLVVGSDGGLVLVDPVTLRNKEYNFNLGYTPEQTLTKNVVQYVFVDRQDILWVGTEAGIAYAKPSRQLFDLWNISNPSDQFPSAISDWIYSMCEVDSGFWMSRWIRPGLFHFNKNGDLDETLLSIKCANKSLALSDSMKPFYLRSEGDSILWITTDVCLIHYDLRTKQAITYKPPGADSRTGLRTITVIDDHVWWIRTRNNGPNGIYVFDPIKRAYIRHFMHQIGCQDCVPGSLLKILLGKTGNVYVTAVGEGLFKYDPDNDRFVSEFKFQGQELKQHSNSFEALAEDSNGILWIATYSGLFSYDPINKKVKSDYTGNDLLGGVDISGIAFDKQQNIWLTTERGIYYILHSTGQVRELAITRGLKNNSNGMFEIGKDGAIYNGIRGYMVRIFPDEVLNHSDQKASVHFSDATIMDKPSFFHFSSSGYKEITVQPGDYRFTLDFSVLNYDGDNKFYYMLDGVMNKWQENENGHLAFYNLSPGKYTLHVKGGNQYGDLTTNEDGVVIVVRPYWWQTLWFRLLCLALIILLAIIVVRRRILQIRRQATFKQKIAETEMMALRSQMNPHFIFNSLNSIENFMMQNEKRLASSYLNKFARLIRSILDSSRNDLVSITKDLEAIRLYVDLEQLRYNNKFCFKLEIDPLLLNGDYKVPALLIQPYVENAIVHGLAHSEHDGLILTVNAFLVDEYIYYRIEDNGVGREQASYYNQQNKPNHKSMGLGISEERIQIFNRKHNANGGVTITDLYDNGTTPKGTKVEISIKAV